MKRFVFALAAVVLASGPTLASEARVKQAPVASQAMPSARPLLDQMKTFSIRHDTDAAKQAPAEPRVRSGIEVNPWIVPSFN